jgi:hypothetical protein
MVNESLPGLRPNAVVVVNGSRRWQAEIQTFGNQSKPVFKARPRGGKMILGQVL